MLCGTCGSVGSAPVAETQGPPQLPRPHTLLLTAVLFVLQHNVKLQLTHLDVAPDGEATSRAAQKTEAMLKHALEPPKTYGTIATAATSSS